MMPPDLWPSISRALVVALVAWWLSGVLAPALREVGDSRWRRWAWGLALAPFLVPPMLVAYTYLKLFLKLHGHPWAQETLYGVLLFVRVFPVALLGRSLLPARLSRSAWFCYGLLGNSVWQKCWFYWRHRDAGGALAFGLAFLFAFQEFELASLLQRSAWTVALFDAQTQGYTLAASLRWAAVPLVIQIGLCIRLIFLMRAAASDSEDDAEPGQLGCLWIYVSLASIGTIVIPFAALVGDAWPGLPELPRAFSLHRELGVSVSLAGIAATLSTIVAWMLVGRARRLMTAGVVGVCLLGPLLVALSLLVFLNLPGLRSVRDSPLPLLVAHMSVILPGALLLCELIRRRATSSEGWLAVRTPHAPWLRWVYWRRPFFLVWAYGFYLAFFEVTASAILTPASMTPVMVRLYNLMHYGRDTMLSAYVLVIFLAPLMILGLAAALGRAIVSKRSV